MEKTLQQSEIHDYLETFFTENDCQIEKNESGYITVQLTIDMDKALMNRPFYWTYLEKTDGTPNPMKIHLITDPKQAPEDVKGEVIHFGAPRLHQLFAITKQRAGFIRLYENPAKGNIDRQIPLHPWLMLNIKISYECDRKKDILRSLGLNLINGVMIDHFFDKMDQTDLQPKIPDYCFTVSPIIKPESGLKRMETYLEKELHSSDHTWAEEAKLRWAQDLDLLDHFYEDQEEKPETYEVEKKALQDQYEPIIKVEIINGGIFYLNALS